MIVRQGKSTIPILEQTKESLIQAEVNVLGLILNCFHSHEDNYYYYNNYYGK
jgi:Mrp family chromosome partitioning ATPase